MSVPEEPQRHYRTQTRPSWRLWVALAAGFITFDAAAWQDNGGNIVKSNENCRPSSDDCESDVMWRYGCDEIRCTVAERINPPIVKANQKLKPGGSRLEEAGYPGSPVDHYYGDLCLGTGNLGLNDFDPETGLLLKEKLETGVGTPGANQEILSPHYLGQVYGAKPLKGTCMPSIDTPKLTTKTTGNAAFLYINANAAPLATGGEAFDTPYGKDSLYQSTTFFLGGVLKCPESIYKHLDIKSVSLSTAANLKEAAHLCYDYYISMRAAKPQFSLEHSGTDVDNPSRHIFEHCQPLMDGNDALKVASGAMKPEDAQASLVYKSNRADLDEAEFNWKDLLKASWSKRFPNESPPDFDGSYPCVKALNDSPGAPVPWAAFNAIAVANYSKIAIFEAAFLYYPMGAVYHEIIPSDYSYSSQGISDTKYCPNVEKIFIPDEGDIYAPRNQYSITDRDYSIKTSRMTFAERPGTAIGQAASIVSKITSLAGNITNLGSLASPTGASGIGSSLSGAASSMGSNLAGAVPNVGSIAGGLTNSIPNVGNIAGGLTNSIPNVGNIAGGLTNAIPNPANIVSGVTNNITNAIPNPTNIVNGVTSNITSAIPNPANIASGVTSNITSAIPNPSNMVSGVTNNATNAIPNPTNIVSGVTSNVTSAIPNPANIAGGVTNNITNAIPNPTNIVSGVTNNIPNVGNIAGGITNNIPNVGNQITGGLGTIGGAGAVGSTVTNVTNSVTDVTGGVTNAIGGVTGGVTNAIGGVTGGVTNALGGVTGGVNNAIGGVTGGISNAIGGVTGGITGGVTDALGNATGAATGALGGALGGAKGALGGGATGALGGAAGSVAGVAGAAGDLANSITGVATTGYGMGYTDFMMRSDQVNNPEVQCAIVPVDILEPRRKAFDNCISQRIAYNYFSWRRNNFLNFYKLRNDKWTPPCSTKFYQSDDAASCPVKMSIQQCCRIIVKDVVPVNQLKLRTCEGLRGKRMKALGYDHIYDGAGASPGGKFVASTDFATAKAENDKLNQSKCDDTEPKEYAFRNHFRSFPASTDTSGKVAEAAQKSLTDVTNGADLKQVMDKALKDSTIVMQVQEQADFKAVMNEAGDAMRTQFNAENTIASVTGRITNLETQAAGYQSNLTDMKGQYAKKEKECATMQRGCAQDLGMLQTQIDSTTNQLNKITAPLNAYKNTLANSQKALEGAKETVTKALDKVEGVMDNVNNRIASDLGANELGGAVSALTNLRGVVGGNFVGVHMPYMQWRDTGTSAGNPARGGSFINTLGSFDTLIGAGTEERNEYDAQAAGRDKSDTKTSHMARTDGWEGLKAYQMQTTRRSGLVCIGRHEKLFKPYGPENYALYRAGTSYTSRTGYDWPFPFGWSGYANEGDAKLAFPSLSRKPGEALVKGGLDKSLPGDLVTFTVNGLKQVAYVKDVKHVDYARVQNQDFIDLDNWDQGKFPTATGSSIAMGNLTQRRVYKTAVPSRLRYYKEMDKHLSGYGKETGYCTLKLRALVPMPGSNATCKPDMSTEACRTNNCQPSCEDPMNTSCVLPDGQWGKAQVYRPYNDHSRECSIPGFDFSKTYKAQPSSGNTVQDYEKGVIGPGQISQEPTNRWSYCVNGGYDPPRIWLTSDGFKGQGAGAYTNQRLCGAGWGTCNSAEKGKFFPETPPAPRP